MNQNTCLACPLRRQAGKAGGKFGSEYGKSYRLKFMSKKTIINEYFIVFVILIRIIFIFTY